MVFSSCILVVKTSAHYKKANSKKQNHFLIELFNIMLTQICVFDAYGTLFKVASDTFEIRSALGDKSESVQALWRQKQLEYTWLRSLMGTWVNFDEVTEKALDYALAHHQIEDANTRKLLLRIFYSPTLFKDVLLLIQKLYEQENQIAIASNGTRALLEKSAEATGIMQYLSHIISADDAQVFKPSPAYYQMIIQHFGCLPDEVTFFSSNAWDIAGAANFGFRTIWVNRKQTVFEQLGVKPQYVVNSLKKVFE